MNVPHSIGKENSNIWIKLNSNNKLMLYIIIVLYKTKIVDSLTYKAILKNIDILNKIPYRLLVYNNSSEVEIPESNNYEVYTPKDNLKLAGAYNYALQKATEGGYKWLLLLDQDTELTKEYFIELCQFVNSSDSDNYDIAIPILKNEDFYLSPLICKKDIGPFAYVNEVRTKSDINNLSDDTFISAYNSVSLLSVSSLLRIGGFGHAYKLDMLDYYYYYKLSQIHSKVYVFPIYLKQNLSLLEDNFSMSIERFEDYQYSRLRFARSIGLKSIFFYKRLLLHEIIFFIKKKYKNKNIYIRKLIKYLLKW